MNLSRSLGGTALALLLSGCGWISLPEQRANDFYFTNSSVRLTPGQVAYMVDNQLALANIKPPALPYRAVTIDAEVSSAGRMPRVRLEIFAAADRPVCPLVESTLSGFGPALLCGGPAGGQAVGEVNLYAGKSSALHLEGRALDQALRAGKLYLGVRLLEGQPEANTLIYVRKIRFNSRL